MAALHSILITACGLGVLLTPLFLWVAWSPWAFWLVMAGGCTALLIIHALLWTPDEPF
jgi:hypothetical protein